MRYILLLSSINFGTEISKRLLLRGPGGHWDINRIFLTNREFYINIENRIFHINRITMNDRRNSINSQNGYNW